MLVLVFILEIVKDIFENEILWTQLNFVNLKGKIRLQHCNNIFFFVEGSPQTPHSEQQTIFLSSSLFSLRFKKCDSS